MTSMSRSKEKFGCLLDELIDECCNCKYCFLRVFLSSLHPEPIVMIQLKCMIWFKDDMEEKEGREIDWKEAGSLWAEGGWAKAFREVFEEGIPVKKIYELTKQKINP